MRKNALTADTLSVGLDLRSLTPGYKAHFGRGTGRYAQELSNELSKSHGEAKIVPLSADDFALQGWRKDMLNALPMGRQTLENQIFMPQRAEKLFHEKHLSLIHFLSHGDAAAFLDFPYIVTVLDLIPLKFPELYKPKRMTWRFKLARYLELQAIKNAQGVLAISEATKHDLVELLDFPQEKIWVTPLALGQAFRQRMKERPEEADLAQFKAVWRKRRCIAQDSFVICYVGGIDPRKNILFLVDVFAQHLKNRPETKSVLCLAGGYLEDEMYPVLVKRIAELGIGERVKLLGFLSEEELLDLYCCSDLFAFPSLYEGFGFPILEAFAAGLPVIAGKNSAIIEVAGDSAVLLPDNDKQAWSEAIANFAENTNLRHEVGLVGKKRLSKFSWERTAKETIDAYCYFGGSSS